jgi:SAM-dependent methyltransferase
MFKYFTAPTIRIRVSWSSTSLRCSCEKILLIDQSWKPARKATPSFSTSDVVVSFYATRQKCLRTILTFIEVVGTDVRMLTYEGYPGANVIGCDLNKAFLDLGHKLFQDATTCPIHFFVADAFDIPISTPPHPLSASNIPISKIAKLSELANRVTHLHTGAVFHLFDEQRQYELALKIGLLLKREAGAIVFGRQQATKKPGLQSDNIWAYVC